MVFPYTIISSLAVLMSGRTAINAYGYNTNTYVSNPDTNLIARSYYTSGSGYRDLESHTENTYYFFCNPDDKTECLASLNVVVDVDTQYHNVDYTLTLNATNLANCAWIGSIGGIGVEEYEFTEYIGYSIKFNDGLINFNTILNMGTAYQTAQYTYSRTYSNDNALYTSYIYFDIFLNNAHDTLMYTSGYNDGQNVNEGWNLSNYLYSIVDIPVLYLRSMFGFDLFGGISLFAVITTLLTVSVIIFIIRKFIK